MPDRLIILMLLGIFYAATSVAQKKDTSAFYMRHSGELAESKETADYIRLLLPPDTTVDRDLIVINDFYMNGKRKLIARSYMNSINFAQGLQGTALEYYESGRRKSIRSYERGKPQGDWVEYYKNGRPYTEITYTGKDSLYLKTCYDSTGKVLAENGRGEWLKFDEFIEGSTIRGPILNGKPDGHWKLKSKDTVYTIVYQKGRMISGEESLVNSDYVFFKVDVAPTFPGGDSQLSLFLVKTIKYPVEDLKNEVQGRTVVTFVVERDGSLTNFRIVKAVSATTSAEAIRVLKLSPHWLPGKRSGKTVRVQYAIPVSFTITDE